MPGFSRYVLRTSDGERARAFYARACGASFTAALADGTLAIEPLPAGAVASGAPPHWVGFVHVNDVEAKRARLVALGATPLGAPTSTTAVLRDPWGAAFGLTSVAPGGASDARAARPSARETVGWHHLNTRDLDGALAFYRDAFGWSAGDRRMHPGPLGDAQPFVSLTFGDDDGGAPAPAASVSPSVELPFVHPHWWIFFRIGDDARARAIEAIAAHGGRALPAARTAHGDWVVPCEDDLGGAFGLVARA